MSASLALLSACGGAGQSSDATNASGKFDVKLNGKDSTLNVKSGAVYYGGATVQMMDQPGKPTVKTSAHTIYVANYEMDTTGSAWMKEPLAAPGQMRIGIKVTGEDGTFLDSPLKVGTYSAQTKHINSVTDVIINTFADGKQTEARFGNLNVGPIIGATEGEVKITSVTADTVSGEVNLTEGDKAIKGTFTAKLPAATK